MKECRHCGLPKDESEFYKSKNTSDGLHSWCKACHRESMREARFRVGTTTEASTLLVLNELTRRGIPASPGYGLGMPGVDLVAWGCVPIEAKTSQPIGNREGQYVWHFNESQREKWFSGLIVFAGRCGDDSARFFVVPADDIRLREHIIRDDRESLFVNLTDGPFNKNANRELYEWFKAYEDRWDLVEEYRLLAVEQLIDTGK